MFHKEQVWTSQVNTQFSHGEFPRFYRDCLYRFLCALQTLSRFLLYLCPISRFSPKKVWFLDILFNFKTFFSKKTLIFIITLFNFF